MSKIFDMLNKSEGEIADLVRPLAKPQSAFPAMKAAVAEPAEPPAEEPPANAPPPRTHALGMQIAASSPVLPFDEGQWRPGEQYRILRTKLIQHPKQPHMIVVSSPAAGDGKTVTAINTAGALALKDDGKVLLIDADMRRSSVHVQLGLPQSPGLADVLTGTCTLDEAIVQTQEFPNLYVIPSGSAVMNPVELLDSSRWPALCEQLRKLFRFVVLDCPPVSAVADYDLILAACDGVLLVLRPDHTHRQLCRRALDTIPKAKLLGVLMNCVPDGPMGGPTRSDYYYYYNSSSGTGRPTRNRPTSV